MQSAAINLNELIEVSGSGIVVAKHLDTPIISVCIHSNADTDIIGSHINHGLKVPIRVYPISHRLFRNS